MANKESKKTKPQAKTQNGGKGMKLKTTNKQKLLRSGITLLGFLAFFALLFFVLKATGVLNQLDSPQDVKELILSGGIWSYLVFMVIQFLQVTFIPIPALITTVAGALVFGPWITYGLSLISVLLGSLFAFWMGKRFGRKLVVWIAGEEDAKKWDEKLSKGRYLFFLMLLFPGFPDDVLCLLVGASPMTYRFFLTTNLIARPLVFIPIVFLGGGTIIPYSGWGIPVWIGIIILCASLFYLSIRYEDNIEHFLETQSKKMKLWFANRNNKK